MENSVFEAESGIENKSIDGIEERNGVDDSLSLKNNSIGLSARSEQPAVAGSSGTSNVLRTINGNLQKDLKEFIGSSMDTLKEKSVKSQKEKSVSLECVALIDIDKLSLDEEDSWLYKPSKSVISGKQISPYVWLRQEFESQPTSGTLAQRRSLMQTLDHFKQMSKARSLHNISSGLDCLSITDADDDANDELRFRTHTVVTRQNSRPDYQSELMSEAELKSRIVDNLKQRPLRAFQGSERSSAGSLGPNLSTDGAMTKDGVDKWAEKVSNQKSSPRENSAKGKDAGDFIRPKDPESQQSIQGRKSPLAVQDLDDDEEILAGSPSLTARSNAVRALEINSGNDRSLVDSGISIDNDVSAETSSASRNVSGSVLDNSSYRPTGSGQRATSVDRALRASTGGVGLSLVSGMESVMIDKQTTSVSEENLFRHRLNDVTDVKELARLQEESLRQNFATPNISSNRGLSKSLNRSSGALAANEISTSESVRDLTSSKRDNKSSGRLASSVSDSSKSTSALDRSKTFKVPSPALMRTKSSDIQKETPVRTRSIPAPISGTRLPSRSATSLISPSSSSSSSATRISTPTSSVPPLAGRRSVPNLLGSEARSGTSATSRSTAVVERPRKPVGGSNLSSRQQTLTLVRPGASGSSSSIQPRTSSQPATTSRGLTQYRSPVRAVNTAVSVATPASGKPSSTLRGPPKSGVIGPSKSVGASGTATPLLQGNRGRPTTTKYPGSSVGGGVTAAAAKATMSRAQATRSTPGTPLRANSQGAPLRAPSHGLATRTPLTTASERTSPTRGNTVGSTLRQSTTRQPVTPGPTNRATPRQTASTATGRRSLSQDMNSSQAGGTLSVAKATVVKGVTGGSRLPMSTGAGSRLPTPRKSSLTDKIAAPLATTRNDDESWKDGCF